MPTITMSGEQFSIPTPYSAGMTINEHEASALNTAFANGLRSIFGGRIKQAKDKGTYRRVDFQDMLNEYAKTYQVGGRMRISRKPQVDPIRVAAMQIAKEKVLEACKAGGFPQRGSFIKERTEEYFLKNEATLTALGRARVEITQRAAKVDLEEESDVEAA